MSKLQKLGYFLIGVSGGVMLATALYERELRRPIGEIEKYGDIIEDAKETADDISENVSEMHEVLKEKVDAIPDQIMERAKERREEIKRMRKEGDFKTKYSKMYEKGEEKLKDILDQTINSYTNDIPHHPETGETSMDSDGDYHIYDEVEDSPSDDEPIDEKQELVTERVEEWMEVYLGENPQDFISLIFYAGDETLCDDREQLISNPEEVIGEVALERLISGGPGADDGVIFVKNLKTMLDYEVVLDEGKYSETVLGIFESRLNKGDGGDVNNR